MADKGNNKRSAEESEAKPAKKKRTTEAERIEQEARSFVEGSVNEIPGKLKKTLTDYVRNKGPEPSPKKKKTTEAERLEIEARRFVEGTSAASAADEGIGTLKKTLTDFVWDKKSLRQRIRLMNEEPSDTEDIEGNDTEDDEEDQKAPAAKTVKKKGTKRKSKETSKEDKPEDNSGKSESSDGKIQEYSRYAGQQEIAGAFTDRHGNAAGNQYDLIRDNAMTGNTIVVIHSSKTLDFMFADPLKALRKKGYKVVLFTDDEVMSPKELESQLQLANQLWIISTPEQRLNNKHLNVIQKFFDSGRGLALWGDNMPWYEEANYVGKALLATTMHGNERGQEIVHRTNVKGNPGFLPHLLTTGIKSLFEGHTIATISPGKDMQPLMWGTAKKRDSNLISAYYDKGGKRAIMDGAITRLYCNWDDAGCGRFVTNIAGWLSNLESRLKA